MNGSGDYHWYRQDADGFWSHKRGESAVRRTDNSGMKTADPYNSNRGSYTIYVRYYAVTPWNNIYDEPVTAESESFAFGTSSIDSLPYADSDRIALIQNDMTLEEVTGILQTEGKDVGSGTIIHKYQTANGELIVAYCIDANGIYRVVNVLNGGN